MVFLRKISNLINSYFKELFNKKDYERHNLSNTYKHLKTIQNIGNINIKSNEYVLCQITPKNIWDIDSLIENLLEYQENIKLYFAIADENYTEKEKYNMVCLLFKHLILRPNNNANQQGIYRVIKNTEFNFSPKYIRSYPVNYLIANNAEYLYTEKINIYKSVFWKKFFTIVNIKRANFLNLSLRISSKLEKQYKHIYIVGWYGTETVGDKAILGGILDFYSEKYKNVKFHIASIYPFVTQKTIKELNYPEATIVPCDDWKFAKYAAKSDEIVMGGGPLMDMEALAIPLWAFKVAKMFKKKTVIFGCGLGPLHESKYIETVKKILNLSDEIKLRDSNSVEYAKQELQIDREDIVNSGDSAFAYISDIAKNYTEVEQTKTLACFLREWTPEYKGNLDETAFIQLRDKFEDKLAQTIKKICETYQITPAFYPMHSFVVGNDDRDFYRRFTQKYFQNTDYYVYKYNANIDATVQAMKSSSINLCMRFHSVLFAHTLQTNFLAIDYTNGGKIKGFLTDNSSLNRMLSLQNLANASIESIENWYSVVK